MDLSATNVFIFNWVENYDDHVARLKETFENGQLNNKVCTYNQLSSDNLHAEIEKLRQLDFGLFRYVAVVILDNKSTSGNLIAASDANILLHSELLTPFLTNETLEQKTVLTVIQKLADYDTEEDDSLQIAERQNYVKSQGWYRNLGTRHMDGLELTIRANEPTDNFWDRPFLDVFCQEFLNSKTMPIKNIFSNISNTCPIVFGSNQGSNDNDILGSAMDENDSRDYFPPKIN
ncbi:uncharacterized protein LOC101899365 [Musca domestica]|uniref:Uncharacterized protein LOC101899365 n=1 Tax=Musca domestica TaxID=7370 RepID=A0A9J7IAH3_MUSDO|nr:uncharacterized protein LOC101899365 [Musca domestica]XP_058979702.1 uncharacterized protein LOC101899365 [Musca domestica]XP_058979703.1 uncharacterized protein LOC101899365 [Musca domestica]XP_058979704.1 uncharacterized protein LOC101899365 [Musca domestica]